MNTFTFRSTMAHLTKLSLLLILNYTTRLITHSLATTPYHAHNATNANDNHITVCRNTDVWIGPSWPSLPGGAQEVYLLCRILISELYHSQPEIHTRDPPALHEFLPRGMAPVFPDLPNPVRTPWRFTRGTYKYISHKRAFFFPASPRCCCCHRRPHSSCFKLIDYTGLFLALIGPCTLAVTTLDSVPPGYLPPEIRAMGPFRRYGTARWWEIWNDALKYVLGQCASQGRAGMTLDSESALFIHLSASFGFEGCYLGTYQVIGVARSPALGIFMFATNSMIDRALGESPTDSVVRMGGVNRSEDAATM